MNEYIQHSASHINRPTKNKMNQISSLPISVFNEYSKIAHQMKFLVAFQNQKKDQLKKKK